MSGRLKFKGDKPGKKATGASKKKRSFAEHTTDADEHLPEDGWVIAMSADHLEGPMILLCTDTVLPSTLFHPPESPHIVLRALEEFGAPLPAAAAGNGNANADEEPALVGAPEFHAATYEPANVHQVFVIHKLMGASSAMAGAGADQSPAEKWSVKAAEGQYLSAEKDGSVSCVTEAVGPAEEWTPVLDTESRTIALCSLWGGHLTVESPKEKRATWTLRCDAKEIGPEQSFVIKVQAEAVHANRNRMEKAVRRRLTDASEEGVSEATEVDVVRKFQSWGGGRIKLTGNDRHEIVQAKRSGKLAESLLDRREKVKADRYCK
ncbi:FRG1-like family-domain-containing protein [Blastocladiella britannica]|nr:FRG1-like family-domain-containing protein [Blastocladiella britannica]